MGLFFLVARAIRAAYKALRALVGIMIVTHGAVIWVANKRTAAR